MPASFYSGEVIAFIIYALRAIGTQVPKRLLVDTHSKSVATKALELKLKSSSLIQLKFRFKFHTEVRD